MKTIRNKDVVIEALDPKSGREVSKDTTYGELIKVVCKDIPGKGMGMGVDVEEIGKRLRITNVVKDSKNGVFKFEHADAEKLQELVKGMQWGAVCDGIYQFCEDVRNMEDFDDGKPK